MGREVMDLEGPSCIHALKSQIENLGYHQASLPSKKVLLCYVGIVYQLMTTS